MSGSDPGRALGAMTEIHVEPHELEDQDPELFAGVEVDDSDLDEPGGDA